MQLSSQPYVMKYVVETLIEAPEEENPVALTDEDTGFLFLLLKTVVDVLDSELQDQGILQYRELVISPWRVLYRISEKNVFVLSVLDSRRNIQDILLKRLTNSKI